MTGLLAALEAARHAPTHLTAAKALDRQLNTGDRMAAAVDFAGRTVSSKDVLFVTAGPPDPDFGFTPTTPAVGDVVTFIADEPTADGTTFDWTIDGTVTSPGNGGLLGIGRQSGDDGFVGFITALTGSTSARLLSTPSVLTLNNTEAEIVVAQSVPFVTGSFATVGDSAVPEQPFQTIEREDVGLTLRVTPQITGDNTVRMAIEQEVSNLTRTTSAAGGEITSKRTLNTNVLVNDGRVIMLGGLLENGSGAQEQGVPGLKNLPLFGKLFRGRAVNRNQRVLLLLLRPRIVRNDADANRLTTELALDARRASNAIKPPKDGEYPSIPPHSFPFDGANLNQPFDAGFVDPYARTRTFPPLPSRLEFNLPQ